MKIHTEFVQYSPEFWQLRRGKVSASNMGRIITPKTKKLAAAHDEYINELIADTIRLDPPFMTEKPVTRAMQHGTDTEPEARRWLEYERGCTVLQVGGIETDDERLWASPDGFLLDNEGEMVSGLELKCPDPKTHVGYLRDQECPQEYLAQVHGSLLISCLPMWLFMSYCAGFPALVVKVTPNLFTESLKLCLDEFLPKYDAALETIRSLS